MINAAEIFNAKILIVDDQASNILLLQEMLRATGYTSVTSTMDPRTVVELHSNNRYDLILLDLQMPELDGFQVMQGLKTIDADDYLPILVVTAQPAHKLRALQAGAKDFISKPFDVLELKTRIHNMLEVRLLYRQVERYSKTLEHMVEKQTAELRESEARFRALREMAEFCAQIRQRNPSRS